MDRKDFIASLDNCLLSSPKPREKEASVGNLLSHPTMSLTADNPKPVPSSIVAPALINPG